MASVLSLLLVTTALSVVMLFVLTSLRGSNVAGIREWGKANAFAILAPMLAGFRRHLALPVPTRILLLGILAATAGVTYFHYQAESLAMRTVIVPVVHAGIYFAIGRTITPPPSNEPRLRYAFLFTRRAPFVLGSVHVCRGAFYAMQVGNPLSFLDPATYDLVFFAIGTLVLPALTLGAVMMANAQVIRETAYAADHDDLTGAWWRRAFFTFAEYEHARAERIGSPLWLLVFDADFIKRINDTPGHATGDRVLRDIVTHAQGVIRKIDYCARLGGEEFAVLLPDASHLTAMDVAARLRAVLDRSLQLAPMTIPVSYTVSIGVATLAAEESLAGIMARADAAADRAASRAQLI